MIANVMSTTAGRSIYLRTTIPLSRRSSYITGYPVTTTSKGSNNTGREVEQTRPLYTYRTAYSITPKMPSDSESSDSHPAQLTQGQGVKDRTIKPKPVHQQQKRPTHFLCLPLTTPDSVSQLAKSLATFRRITTPPPNSNTDENQPDSPQGDREGSPSEPGDDQSVTMSASANPESKVTDEELTIYHSTPESLRIIPPAAHRAPGTFHLTLGTMDLSDKEIMQKTVKFLKAGDWTSLFKNVQKELESSLSHSRARDQMDNLATGSKIADRDQMVDEPAAVEGTSQVEPTQSPESQNNGSIIQISSLERPISPPYSSRPQHSHASTLSTNSILAVSSSPHYPSGIRITLHSLSTFPHAHSSRVFYALPFDPSSRLQHLANRIRDSFLSAGLLLPEPPDRRNKPVVLHATVANLIYVKPENAPKRGGRGGKYAKRKRGKGADRVDAREVIDFFSREGEGRKLGVDGDEEGEHEGLVEGAKEEEEMGFIWARNIPVDRLRICKMGAVKSQDEVWGMEYFPIEDSDGGEPAEVHF